MKIYSVPNRCFLTTAVIAITLLPNLAILTFAQVAKMISAGVLNGKTVALPRPEYPPAARAVRASGPVSVQIVVDETGDVVSATALSGHPLLRKSAETSAKQAKFKPFTLNGKVVRATGTLIYNFSSGDQPAKGTSIKAENDRRETKGSAAAGDDEEKSQDNQARNDGAQLGKAIGPDTTAAAARDSIVGSWLYTGIINADGSVTQMRNRQSSLEIGADGRYNQNIWAGNHLQGHGGTYSVNGARLTLDWDGQKEIYTMIFGADGTLTLKADDGSGWQLERAR